MLNFVIKKNEFYQFCFPNLRYILLISKQLHQDLLVAWTFPFCNWLLWHLGRILLLTLVCLVMVKIQELLPHHFEIRLHLQFVDVASIAILDIVQNSIVSIDEV